MKRAILSNFKQGILSISFAVGTVAIAVLIFLSSIETILNAVRGSGLLYSGFHTSLVLNALKSDSIAFFTPVAAVLPMAAAYVEDIKSNYVRYYLFRSSHSAYIIGRICGSFVSGGLVLLLGILLAYGASSLLFLPMERAASAGAENVPGLRDVILPSFLFFLSGGFWALLGLAMSTLMESKFIAYASPFILYYLLVILHERYFTSLFVLSPKEWLVPSDKCFLGSWGPAVIVLELTLLAAMLFAINAERRLRQL